MDIQAALLHKTGLWKLLFFGSRSPTCLFLMKREILKITEEEGIKSNAFVSKS